MGDYVGRFRCGWRVGYVLLVSMLIVIGCVSSASALVGAEPLAVNPDYEPFGKKPISEGYTGWTYAISDANGNNAVTAYKWSAAGWMTTSITPGM